MYLRTRDIMSSSLMRRKFLRDSNWKDFYFQDFYFQDFYFQAYPVGVVASSASSYRGRIASKFSKRDSNIVVAV